MAETFYIQFSVLLIQKNIQKTKRQTNKLKAIFGEKIEKYIEKIIEHPKSDKIAICDLATK